MDNILQNLSTQDNLILGYSFLIYIWVMFVDIAVGTHLAKINGKYKSHIQKQGLMTKMLNILMVVTIILVFNLLSVVLGFPLSIHLDRFNLTIQAGIVFVLFQLYMELSSLVEICNDYGIIDIPTFFKAVRSGKIKDQHNEEDK